MTPGNESESTETSTRAAFWQWFLRVVCLDMFNPANTFVSFLRRVVLVNGALVGGIAIFFFLQRVLGIVAGTMPLSTAMYASFGQSAILGTATLAPYFWCMRNKETPSALIFFELYGSTFSGWLIIMTNPSFPIAAGAVTYSVFASVCDMHMAKPMYVLLAGLYTYSSWNYAALATGQEPVALPGYAVATFRSVMTNCMAGLLLITVPVACCVMQTRHARRMLTAANAANQLSRDAAELLRNYDTDGLSKLLEEYRAADDADPALIESYTALVDNLNKYRPHLPNWMIRSDDDSDGRTPCGSEHGTGVVKTARSSVSQGHSLQSAQSNAVTPRAHVSAVPATMATAVPATATIALAVVEYVAQDASAATRGAAVSRFVDHAHSIANVTHGALHSFVGDTVQLSWNAAMRVAQPEVKAVRFLCRLATAMANDPGVVVSGAAMCGKATTQFAGTGKVQALAIAVPWRAALQACHAVARPAQTFVVCGALAEAAHAFCETRAVEVLRFDLGQHVGSNPAAGEVVVHEVVSEHDDEDDEWMYVLDKKGKDPVTEALELCVDRRYADAMAALGALPPETLAAPLVLRLRDRAEQALLGTTKPFAVLILPSVLPTHMTQLEQ
jgi:hypothetical protein